MTKKQYGMDGFTLCSRIIQYDGKPDKWVPCECPHHFKLVRKRNYEGDWQYFTECSRCSLLCPLFSGVREMTHKSVSINLCSRSVVIDSEDFFPKIYEEEE